MDFNIRELSGSLGDLGTFIPLVTSAIIVCGLDPGSVLFFAGIYNIITGFIFQQPIPVQPMKAITAVAIAEALSPGSIAAAGIGMGVILLLFALTGLINWLERVVPSSVVRGIQLGVGLKLALKGVALIEPLPVLGSDSLLWALILGGGILFFQSRWDYFPGALISFVWGLVLIFFIQPGIYRDFSFGWGGLNFILPSLEEWKTGLLYGTIPQLPLTVLNSVIAVCALSAELFRGKGIKSRPMTLSVAMMNLVGCWFGAMPMCHGSGGLAGQYHFGARTGGSVVMLGLAKVLLAVALGNTAIIFLKYYPKSVLGILLIFSGLELALPARRSSQREQFFISLVTAMGTLAINTFGGFLMGIVSALLFRGDKN